LDKLIKYINENSDKYNAKIFYSTPSEYINSIAKQNIEFERQTNDLFPYSDGPAKYWTGYFTSRVNLKYYIKECGRYL